MCLMSEWKESIYFLHLTILDSTNISPIYLEHCIEVL